MKTKYLLFSKWTLTLTTDKSPYQYGETIEVRLEIANNTNSSFTIAALKFFYPRINLSGFIFVQIIAGVSYLCFYLVDCNISLVCIEKDYSQDITNFVRQSVSRLIIL